MRLPRRRVAPVRTACTARFFVAAVLVFLTAIGAFGQIRFRDVASEAGVDFVLESGPTPRKPMIEAVAGGVAAFDADEDGLIDIYFVNGADAGSLRKRGPSHWNRLYRNLGGMRFSDVTETSGVSGIGYSMGVAVGDYDNDGDGDLFVAGYRANILYRNNGRGRIHQCHFRGRDHQFRLVCRRRLVRLRPRRCAGSTRRQLSRLGSRRRSILRRP